jgi:uncharacterized protein YigE (DUF2233 family)
LRLLLHILLLLTIFGISPVLAQPKDQDMLLYTATPAAVSLYWKDAQGKVLGNSAALKAYTALQQRRLVFAMNGGMYQEDQSPLGLFIENGHKRSGLNTRSGTGNFYLKPNGVFYIRKDNKAFISTTTAFRSDSTIRYATQSGPMLLIKGKIHPEFRQGSKNLNIRNGVGLLPGNRLLFVLSKVPVSLYDFAACFKQKGCTDALYLDGFVSRAYLPAQGWVQTDGNFGVMIGVTE